MLYDRNRAGRINSFAVVSYIPDPLAAFLNRLRQEMVPSCDLRAHLTLLPPRPLASAPDVAWRQIRSDVCSFPSFDVELTSIELFPVSDVIYVAIGRGFDQLIAMHQALNRGRLTFQEPFRYHPHVTLGQNLDDDQVDEFSELARARWKEYPHSRCFRVDRLTFVQSTCQCTWLDLHECDLIAGHDCDLVLR